MKHDLHGLKVAILATDGFEQLELEEPRRALIEAGAKPVIVSPKEKSIQGWNHDQRGDEFKVELTLARANPADFDALMLPGGVMNPDSLRMDEKAVEFVRAFFIVGKPVAAICHGVQMLIEAGVVRDRVLTSFPSLRTDLVNAGAEWVDEEVVCDQGLVTSRTPDDLPAFNQKMVEEIAEGRHAGQRIH